MSDLGAPFWLWPCFARSVVRFRRIYLLAFPRTVDGSTSLKKETQADGLIARTCRPIQCAVLGVAVRVCGGVVCDGKLDGIDLAVEDVVDETARRTVG